MDKAPGEPSPQVPLIRWTAYLIRRLGRKDYIAMLFSYLAAPRPIHWYLSDKSSFSKQGASVYMSTRVRRELDCLGE